MDVQPLDMVRLGLAFVGLALVIFTLGALISWRLAWPAARQEPRWLFLLRELAWLPMIGALLLSEFRAPFAWAAWLSPVVLVMWAMSFVLRYRARRRSAPE